MCLVSIIIPTYKHQDFVLATLDSVFAQTFTDYEVIVINDGSPDGTAAVLRPLAEAGGIRYIEQKNAGQSAARNRGIAEARGEFIALLDDDDLWPPDKLEWQVQALREDTDAVLVYGGASLVKPEFDIADAGTLGPALYPEKEASKGNAYREFIVTHPPCSPGQTLIRTGAIKQVGCFDEAIWGADDYDLNIRLSKLGDFIFRKRVALYYRQHPENASKDFRRHYKSVCAVRHKHLGQFPFSLDNRLWLSTYRYWHRIFLTTMLSELHICVEKGDKARGRRIWRWIMLMPPNPPLWKYMLDLIWQLR